MYQGWQITEYVCRLKGKSNREKFMMWKREANCRKEALETVRRDGT